MNDCELEFVYYCSESYKRSIYRWYIGAPERYNLKQNFNIWIKIITLDAANSIFLVNTSMPPKVKERRAALTKLKSNKIFSIYPKDKYVEIASTYKLFGNFTRNPWQVVSRLICYRKQYRENWRR